jgi:GDPmannose 4,6-dehydratase
VIASGVSRSVRELVATAFACVGLDPDEHVKVDEALVRPPDPVPLVGNPAKAEAKLGWRRETSFEETVAMMVEADLEQLREEAEAGARAAR